MTLTTVLYLQQLSAGAQPRQRWLQHSPAGKTHRQEPYTESTVWVKTNEILEEIYETLKEFQIIKGTNEILKEFQ